MSLRNQEPNYITISIAVERTGLSRRIVLECVERELVVEPLTDQDLADLRRIRRLRELGVNMPGIEIILHMRQRIQELQAEVLRLEQAWDNPESEDFWP